MPLPRPQLVEREAHSSVCRRCKWPAVLRCKPMNLSCMVEDISAGGCRISVASNRIDGGVGTAIELDIVSKGVVFVETNVLLLPGEAGSRFGAYALPGGQPGGGTAR